MLLFYICIIIKSEKKSQKTGFALPLQRCFRSGRKKTKRAIIFQIALTHQREIEFWSSEWIEFHLAETLRLIGCSAAFRRNDELSDRVRSRCLLFLVSARNRDFHGRRSHTEIPRIQRELPHFDGSLVTVHCESWHQRTRPAGVHLHQIAEDSCSFRGIERYKAVIRTSRTVLEKEVRLAAFH